MSSGRLLYLLTDKLKQQVLLLPLMNQNIVPNNRDFENHNSQRTLCEEQRFLMYEDDTKYIRMYQI